MKNKDAFLAVANEVMNEIGPPNRRIEGREIRVDSMLDFRNERDLYVFWFFAETLGYKIVFKEENMTLPDDKHALALNRKEIMLAFYQRALFEAKAIERKARQIKWFGRDPEN